MAFLAAAVDAPPWWALLVGGLGIGAIVSAFVQGAIGLITASRQRQHELAIKARDHTHELQLKQIEDGQRLRDQRLGRLRDAFGTLVSSLLALEDVMWEMHRDPTSTPTSSAAWEVILNEANRGVEGARPILLLDATGERAVRGYVDLTNQLREHRILIVNHKSLAGTPGPTLVGAAKIMQESRRVLIDNIAQEIAAAREDLWQIEYPGPERTGPVA